MAEQLTSGELIDYQERSSRGRWLAVLFVSRYWAVFAFEFRPATRR